MSLPFNSPTPEKINLSVEKLYTIVKQLRHPETGCPWDKDRKLDNIGKYLLDEAQEAAEALETKNYQHQCEELGDVLLNIVMAIIIAEEKHLYTWEDVVNNISDKMIRRHPHVFAEEKATTAEEALQYFLDAKKLEKTNFSTKEARE